MREIKFRGIPLEWNQFVYGGYIFYQERYFIYTEMYEKATHIGILSQVQVDSDTIGQYTGLRDQGSKKIYEGDIVKLRLLNQDLVRTVFQDYSGSWCINVPAMGSTEVNGMSMQVASLDVEIIGNIHENPEHLESIN